MQISPILWLAAAVGFLALEASTFNMTSIWFAIGSAAALLCCVFTGSFRVQAVVFLVVSILCLAAFRPLAAKLRLKHTATNGDRNLGREAIVLSPVTAEVPGRVRLDGVDEDGKMPGIQQVSVVHGLGENVHEITSSSERMGFVVAQGNDPQEAIDRCEAALRKINIVLE